LQSPETIVPRNCRFALPTEREQRTLSQTALLHHRSNVGGT
jgi:hypothetical protein